MKTIFPVIISLFLFGCKNDQTERKIQKMEREKQNLEVQLAACRDRSNALEKRVESLLVKLDEKDKQYAKIEAIKELARNTLSKVQDLNVSALDYPNAGSAELKQSSAILIIMKSDLASKACEEMNKAIENLK